MHIATESLPWCCEAATGAPSSWGGQPNAGPIARFEWSYARKTPINVHVGKQKLGGRPDRGSVSPMDWPSAGPWRRFTSGLWREGREERLVPRRSSKQAIRESVTFGCPPRSGHPGYSWTVGLLA